MKILAPATAIIGLLVLPQPVKADDFPKSGQATFDQYATWKILASADAGIGREFVAEGNGITLTCPHQGT